MAKGSELDHAVKPANLSKLAFSSRPQHFKGAVFAAALAAHAGVIITPALNLVLVIMLMPVVAVMVMMTLPAG